ncbi:MAG: TetR/AcrR family transcriptional regulator [Spirochaetota bacterium]
MTTREHIVETAIGLFNEHGTDNITTNHIIDALNISPGTFYYHYRNKEEIIRKVFQRIKDDFARTITIDRDDMTFDSIVENIRVLYGLYYTYRFFFVDIVMLLRRDEVLADMYAENLNDRRESLYHLFNMLADHGFIKRFDSDSSLRMFLHNMWIINDFWLSYLSVQTMAITPDCVDDGMVQFFVFLRPYLTDEILPDIDRLLQNKGL